MRKLQDDGDLLDIMVVKGDVTNVSCWMHLSDVLEEVGSEADLWFLTVMIRFRLVVVYV